jgi:Tfp pilus assembly protein PilE
MKNIKHSQGFSILETLLTTVVVIGILLAIFNFFEDYAEKVLAKSTAKYFNSVSDAVEEMINNKNYFNIIYAMADAETNDILELNLNDLINGFGLVPNDIAPSTVLNANLRQQTPLKTGVNIMVLPTIRQLPLMRMRWKLLLLLMPRC